MDGSSYDEDYATEGGDESCSLLQDSRRRTPLHINNYLSQMEKLQKQRKQRQRQVRLLTTALGFVTFCGIVWTRQSHMELVTSLLPKAESSLRANFARTAVFCDTRQCLDLIPRSSLDLSATTCASVDPALYENLARYVFDSHYVHQWPHDPAFQCTQPTLLNFTISPKPNTQINSCRYHADAVAVEAVGTFDASGDVELVTASLLVPRDATHATPDDVRPFAPQVSEKWYRNSLQGMPYGVINPTHEDGIWLTVYFPTNDVASELNIVVRRGTNAIAGTMQLNTSVALPSHTGLLAVRLDRDLHQSWPAGDYIVVIQTDNLSDPSQLVPFTVLPTDAAGQNTVFREKYELMLASPSSPNATQGVVCASKSENLTAYCSCQRQARQG